MKKVAIIILHYGNEENTSNCLASIKRIHSPYYVYIVNNASYLSIQRIKKIIPSSSIITNKKNLGYADGMNRGIEKAMGDGYEYFLLLNNDVTVKSDILIKLQALFAKKDCGLVGSIITYEYNKNIIWYGGGIFNQRFCYTKHKNMNKPLRKSQKKWEITDFITGAVFMTHKRIIEKIGYFDIDYFLYWEDVDFSIRARNAGFKAYIVTMPLASHKVSVSTGIQGSNILSPLRAYYYARNPFLFMKKNNYYNISQIVGQLFIRLPYYVLQTSNSKAMMSYLIGIKDGLRFR